MNKLIKRRLLTEKGFPKDKSEIINLIYNNIKHNYNDRPNSEKTREEIKNDLQSELGSEFSVECDEINNRPEMVDLNCVVATVFFDHNIWNGTRYGKYLFFGNIRNKQAVIDILWGRYN